LIVCCVHCYAVRLIIAFVDVNKTYLILSYKWLAVSCRSSAGQGKLAGQRPTFYHCNTQTNQDVIPEPTGADPKIPNLYIHGVTLRAADTKAWPIW